MEEKKDMKVDIKSVLKTVILLYAVLIFVGILTYVLPAGLYETQLGPTGKPELIEGTFHFLDGASPNRVPWYRWLTAPIETLFLDSDKLNMLEIIAMILVLGGCFKILEKGGGMSALIKLVINKFKNKRFAAIWLINLLMMLLTSFFGVQDELLILFPIMLSFSAGMGWSKNTALELVLITTGVGFTCAMLNPFTVGAAQNFVSTEWTVLDGLWYRALMFVILYVVTSFFLVKEAKRDEAKHLQSDEENEYTSTELTPEERRKAFLVLGLFGFVLLLVIIFAAVPALQKLGLGVVVMGGAFVIGTIVVGGILLKWNFKEWFKAFGKGALGLAPSALVILTAFSIKYLAVQADILHTIFYYISGLLTRVGPYVGVIILLFFILLIEFFIPSATAKVSLLIPILTLGTIPGISTNVIILAFILGDGYTNVLFPTCGTLMIGLGVANVSYIDWLKKTGLFQLLLLGSSIIFLEIAVLIGL